MSLLIHDAFLSPALELLPTLEHYRQDLDYSDAEFLTLGVRRINTYHPSGRSFLQSVRQCEVSDVSLKAYFGACRSRRRLKLAHELNTAVSWQLRVPSDRFAAFPELHGRDILALDGHDIRHGSHEPAALTRRGESKVPDTLTGVFLRDLRTGGARVLTQTHGHQHEWAAVKACPWEGLPLATGGPGHDPGDRSGGGGLRLPAGRQVQGGFTVITRTKENLVVRESRPLSWDRKYPPNQGVLSDERVWFSEAGEFRRIRYRDPESGTVYELLTTEFHLPPGIIAQIYRLRWDIEKFFDVCENLLAEARAWGAGRCRRRCKRVSGPGAQSADSPQYQAGSGGRPAGREGRGQVRGGASSPGTRGQVAGPVGVALGAGVATDHSLEQSVYPMAAGCLAASLGVDRRPGQAAATHARLSPLAPLAAPANPLTDPPTSMLSHPCPPAVPFSMQHALALSLFVEVTPIGESGCARAIEHH
ncbi:MAG: transposase [Verrucomicrobia bacterium]|nr:transposase [Verrucomicrobiota bacterium]